MTTKEAVDLGLNGNEAAIVAAATAESTREFEKTRSHITKYVDGLTGRIETVEGDLAAFGLKMRPDGSIGSGAGRTHAAAPLLASDDQFANWLAGPRSRKSSFSTNLSFGIQTKAITPILNVGPTGYFPAIRGPQVPALRLVELFPAVPLTLGSAVSYTKETSYVPGALPTLEGNIKPPTGITFVNQLATVQTIATVLKISVQSLQDTPSMSLWLDQRLRYAVQLAAENLFLNDPADGLLAAATALAPEFTPPATGATALDYIGGAVGQLQAAGYTPDGVVVSGVDANQMRLLKTSYGEYLWSSPDSALGATAVWAVPVVISPSLASGTFLVGAFSQSTLLFERQTITVEISFENEDDFVRNLCTMRGEERCALSIPVPSGLIKGTAPAPLAASSQKR